MTHVLGSDCVNDGSGSKEEECLEERVVHHVHDSCDICCTSEEEKLLCVLSSLETQGNHVCSCSESEDHVSELGQGGVCENPLDVHVVECHRCGVDCGESTDSGNDDHCVGAVDEDRVRPCNQVDTCLDHGCCVNERGNSSGSGHCVRQPVVQGELCRLSNDSCEHEEDGDHEKIGVCCCNLSCVCEDGCVVKRFEQVKEDEQTCHETDVTETGDEERLLCCG